MLAMYMTPSSIPNSISMNGMGGAGLVDGSGTINPAALNSSDNLPPSSALNSHSSLRGQKRSRSPDHDEDGGVGSRNDDQKAKKRGRPSTGAKVASDKSLSIPSPETAASDPIHAPPRQQDLHAHDQSLASQQGSPTKTPTKPPVLKALPTVRDHTTDQLTPEGDEYIPREFDQEGEKKLDPVGVPLGGREYRMRTFHVEGRSRKLFMLATECARVLGYRDSYLLFNKNRSLYKIIATQAEKDALIQEEILPYSYRSRQIAIVTAKSMFRQFGARVINDGRRVRDDYWEAKARKQGFTEEDMAGDKRPGTGRARDAAAMEAASNTVPVGIVRQDVTYRDAPLPSDLGGHLPPPNPNMPIPMIQTDVREFGNIPRQRQDISGVPYQDKTQPSPSSDIMHQASNAAEMNKSINQQRNLRAQNFHDSWNKKVEPTVPAVQQKMDQASTMNPSPHHVAAASLGQSHQQPPLQHDANASAMSPQRYRHQPNPQNPHTQSPLRNTVPPSMRSDLHHPQRSSVYNPNQHATPQPASFSNYPHPGSQMWGQPPPNPSPHSQPHQSPVSSHHSSMSQHFSPSPHQQHLQPPTQSPHHQPQHALPQLQHGGAPGNYYGNLGAMQGNPNMYGAMAQQRSMYQQQPGAVPNRSPNPQQQAFMQQTSGAPQQGMQGFAPPPMNTSGPNWGNYPSSTGY